MNKLSYPKIQKNKVADKLVHWILWAEGLPEGNYEPLVEHCSSCKQPKNALPTNQCKYGNKYHLTKTTTHTA